jgi:HK97 family phage prohead protease
MSKLETRVNLAQFEVREEGEEMTFEGYASVFNSPSEPLPFREYVAPGAFTRSLKSRNDIKLLWNHDTGAVLGSTRAGTLRLSEDDRGLKVVASLAPTSLGRDVAALIKRGDVDSMSFGFSVIKDSWNAEGTERTLNSVRLHEVSIVSFPAYKGTAGSTSVRGLELAAQRADVDPDALADALLKVEAGEEITTDDRDLLSRVIDKLAPTPEPASDDLGMLALKKKKLKLLEM